MPSTPWATTQSGSCIVPRFTSVSRRPTQSAQRSFSEASTQRRSTASSAHTVGRSGPRTATGRVRSVSHRSGSAPASSAGPVATWPAWWWGTSSRAVGSAARSAHET
jgi:hypothetical protein